MPQRALPDATIAKIREMVLAGVSFMKIARHLGVARNSVIQYGTGVKEQMKADAATAVKPKKFALELPDAIEQPFDQYPIDTPGHWLILSDIHIPYHDRATVEAAIAQAKADKVVGVLLNGDALDAHELSDFDREPDAPRYIQERDMGQQFLAWLRQRLPKAEIVFKEGNHEERLKRYIVKRAPALFGFEEITVPSLLKFEEYGVEWVDDKRIIKMGMLSVVHGHEFQRGITAPVNPARGFFLKSKECVIAGHHHQTSEHHEPTLSGKPQAAWSTGCACGLHPRYMPVNKWNHGFAMVDLARNGEFSVRNLRVIHGKTI